jgi:hypothetical protein
VTEAELESQIYLHCKARGIKYFHHRNSIGTTPGFVDDVLLGPNGLLWVENKSESGYLEPAQKIVKNMLLDLGQPWRLWRPRDLRSGLIVAELEAIA